MISELQQPTPRKVSRWFNSKKHSSQYVRDHRSNLCPNSVDSSSQHSHHRAITQLTRSLNLHRAPPTQEIAVLDYCRLTPTTTTEHTVIDAIHESHHKQRPLRNRLLWCLSEASNDLKLASYVPVNFIENDPQVSRIEVF